METNTSTPDDEKPPTAADTETGVEEAGVEQTGVGNIPQTMLQVALSVIAAALGVQTSANRKRDFTQGNPLAFILGGLIFTLLFVMTLIFIVSLVLDS